MKKTPDTGETGFQTTDIDDLDQDIQKKKNKYIKGTRKPTDIPTRNSDRGDMSKDPYNQAQSKYPMESTIHETTTSLNAYISTLGYNPKFMNRNQKQKFAQSEKYAVWVRTHQQKLQQPVQKKTDKETQTETMMGKVSNTPTGTSVGPFEDYIPEAGVYSVDDPQGTMTKVAENNKKRELSKSARIIKAIYRKHRLKEDTIEEEKIHKVGDTVYPKVGPHKGHPHKVISSATKHGGSEFYYNVKPMNLKAKDIKYYLGAAKAKPHELSVSPLKEDMTDPEKESKDIKAPSRDKQPEKIEYKAEKTFKGGTTMTKQPRDTIEIDPEMLRRPSGTNGK